MIGYIHLYTGNGKGKTTAALGLALRALGAGKNIFIAQFVKGRLYSELLTIDKYLPKIKYKQYGLDCFIINSPTQADVDIARKGLEEVSEIILSDSFDMVILDEITIALHYNLFSSKELIDVLKNKPKRLEIVMTGRYAKPEIIDISDLVTEMNEIKHYYNDGVQARIGIEY